MEDKEKMRVCSCKDREREDIDTDDVEEIEEGYGEFNPVEFPIYFDTENGYLMLLILLVCMRLLLELVCLWQKHLNLLVICIAQTRCLTTT